MDFGETFLAIVTGLGLSVACGFRAFIPLLVVSITAKTGNLELAEGFTWLGEWPALIAFSIAAVTETILYYLPVPALGSLVDIVDGPLVFMAGTVLSGSMFTDMDPLLQWSLAAIAGGGSAELLHLGMAVLSVASTVATFGFAPLISTAENAGAVAVPILVILEPVFTLFLFLALLGVTAFAIRKWIVKRRRMPAQTPHSL